MNGQTDKIKYEYNNYHFFSCLWKLLCSQLLFLFKHVVCGQASNLTLQKGGRKYINDVDKLNKSALECMYVYIGGWGCGGWGTTRLNYRCSFLEVQRGTGYFVSFIVSLHSQQSGVCKDTASESCTRGMNPVSEL